MKYKKKYFIVYDSGKYARQSSGGWDRCHYDSMYEAICYARHWLGDVSSIPDDWDGKSINYSGYGDTIEIRHEEML